MKVDPDAPAAGFIAGTVVAIGCIVIWLIWR